MEARLILRNGEQLLLAVVIPVIVLIGGVAGADHIGIDFTRKPVDVLSPGRAGAGGDVHVVRLAGDRDRLRAPVRRDQASRHLPAPPLRAAARQGRRAADGRGAAGCRDRRGGRRDRLAPRGPPSPRSVSAVLLAVLGTAAFASLGLFLAGVLRAEATLAAANLAYLLLLAGGAVVLPSSSYGDYGRVARAGCPPAPSATGCGWPSSTAGSACTRSSCSWSGAPSAPPSPCAPSAGSSRPGTFSRPRASTATFSRRSASTGHLFTAGRPAIARSTPRPARDRPVSAAVRPARYSGPAMAAPTTRAPESLPTYVAPAGPTAGCGRSAGPRWSPTPSSSHRAARCA